MEKRKLVFYGAGEHAMLTHKRTLERTGAWEPVAFCDRDPYKQGKQLLGLPVFSFSELNDRYNDFDVYITANEHNAPDIIGFLLENGVSEERIVNYEPVEKRPGCSYLESLLHLKFNGEYISVNICDCICELERVRERPVFNIKPTDFSVQKFGEAMTFINEMADAVQTGNTPEYCESCPFIKTQYFYKNRLKRHLAFGGNVACNYKCLHCAAKDVSEKFQSSVYNWLDTVIDVIESSGFMHEDATIAYSLGEPTIDKRHETFLRKIERHPLMIFSNGYLYSEAIAEALEHGCAELYVSVDAGTAESYRKIKGVDGFSQVCENLRRYSEHGIVVLKYIMFEGINSNDNDLKGFHLLADDVADLVILSRDFFSEEALSDETLKKVAEFIVRYRAAAKLSQVVGYNRTDEKKRLQEYLDEYENAGS